jgi:hypothetical protein
VEVEEEICNIRYSNAKVINESHSNWNELKVFEEKFILINNSKLFNVKELNKLYVIFIAIEFQ